MRTAAERPGDVALRTPRDTTVITWAEYAERVERIAAGLLALGVRARRHGRADAPQPPRVPPRRHGGAARGRDPVLALQHELARAGGRDLRERAARSSRSPSARCCRSSPRRRAPSRRCATSCSSTAATTTRCSLDDARGARRQRPRPARGRPRDATRTTSPRSSTPRARAARRRASSSPTPTCSPRRAPRRSGSRCRPPAGSSPTCPAAHIVDRWQSHYHGSLGLGCTVTCVADPRQVLAVLPDVRPTLWGGVPRVLEKLRAALMRRGVDDPGALTIEERIALREQLGLGDAALARRRRRARPRAGARVLRPARHPHRRDLGDVGDRRPGPRQPAARDPRRHLRPPGRGHGAASRARQRAARPRADDHARLPPASRERTRRAFTTDGWLRTGDIASMDEDGYVAIVDRKKDIIISSAGKNMAPARIERTLAGGDTRIAAVVVIGDRRPYNVALVVLEPEADPDDPESARRSRARSPRATAGSRAPSRSSAGRSSRARGASAATRSPRRASPGAPRSRRSTPRRSTRSTRGRASRGWRSC